VRLPRLEAMAPGEAARRAFPDTLRGFGYEFRDDRLYKIGSDEGFTFEERPGDQAYNQARYEALGEVITDYVYAMLEARCQLSRLAVPASPAGPGFVFASSDWQSSERLLVLVHGSGVVRAGQWARRLIINDCLSTGTMAPFIARARSRGCATLLLNTNQRSVALPDGGAVAVPHSHTPISHALQVWQDYVARAQATKIAIVAHSYGGVVVAELFRALEQQQTDRVCGVALTDSVHGRGGGEAWGRLRQVSRNWVTSSSPLDTPVDRTQGDIPAVSAGVTSHEMTSSASMDSIFKFLDERLKEDEN